ncbi:MAG: ribosomal L7Ae/L30e/S12e/Gadd45 family protein [bacterium]|nr:ribosomal L7Ae/L30e/S12e/Gadd45 family protein [bacterium]
MDDERSRKFHSLLGIAQKARAIVSGTALCQDSIGRRIAKMIIVAQDAPVETQNSYARDGARLGIPIIIASTRQELGMAIGKSARVAVVLTDTNFCKRLLEIQGAEIKEVGKCQKSESSN